MKGRLPLDSLPTFTYYVIVRKELTRKDTTMVKCDFCNVDPKEVKEFMSWAHANPYDDGKQVDDGMGGCFDGQYYTVAANFDGGYIGDYFTVKFNYCPMCGRKL